MKDLTIVMDNTRGRPADILERLAQEGVEVVAGCLYPRMEGRVAHVTVRPEDTDKVRAAASASGALVLDERDVLVVERGRAGTTAEVARKVADAGASVYVSYFGANGELVLGTSDIDLARQALGV